jgi:ubiquitin carboxyl-terminal hydrolase 5/13
MTELQVEQNMKFDFAMTGGDGGDLEPLFGPGLTGLSNLGNSCYMASVLQTLFSIPEFSDRYFTKGAAHSLLCQKQDSANCFECQMAKIGDGLLSGRYAIPRTAEEEEDATAKAFSEGGGSRQVEKPAGSGQEAVPESTAAKEEEKKTKPFQVGIKPSMFKNLVGKDHAEFKTMRQQDSEEFFKHLIGMIQKNQSSSSSGVGMDGENEVDPTDIFKFTLEEKLQCGECKKVRYKNVNEETLSIPVPFIEKAKDESMDIDGASSSEKGKNAVEGENAQPTTNTSTSTNTGKQDEKTEWESVKLEECLNLLTSAATIEYKCPSCDKNVYANK